MGKHAGFSLLVLLLLPACGRGSVPKPPAWAGVSPEQIAEAEALGVPVAFENSLGMRFVLIPAGTFRMGSTQDEADRRADEVAHTVTLSTAYYMQITEVTNAEYRRLRPEHRSGFLAEPGDAAEPVRTLDDERQPAVHIAWSDARRFAEELTQGDPSRAYRLPTEAEWEHACRGGHGTVPASRDDGTRLVASRSASAWGLFDMHGNALEWCRDWYAPYDVGEGVDPSGPGPAEGRAPQVDVWVRRGEDVERRRAQARVLRGGGWRHAPHDCRCAARHFSTPDDAQDTYGFRLVSPLRESSARP